MYIQDIPKKYRLQVVACKICEKSFIITHAQIRKYCSKECKNIAQGKGGITARKFDENSPVVTKIEKKGKQGIIWITVSNGFYGTLRQFAELNGVDVNLLRKMLWTHGTNDPRAIASCSDRSYAKEKANCRRDGVECDGYSECLDNIVKCQFIMHTWEPPREDYSCYHVTENNPTYVGSNIRSLMVGS